MGDASRTSRAGSQFGPYRLVRLLGRGGMGEVYEAHDTVKGRTVALKLLPPELSDNPVFRARLEREARSAGRLQEPHIVPVHDYGEIDGHLYVDMRLIDGIDLRALLTRDGPLPPARAVALVRQVAQALDGAHAAGVTHRDVKPENILVTAEDFAYLVDFGIANAATDDTLTEQGTTIGTYAYMAPERFTTAEVDHRADVYALGCVLYQCLTGLQPFPADSVSMLITAHLMQSVPRPSEVRPGVPVAFDAVVARAMAKQPADRYANAGELSREAAAVLGASTGDVPSDLLATQHPTMPAALVQPPTARSRRGWLAAAGLGATVLVAAAAIGVWSMSAAPDRMSATQTVTRTVTGAPQSPVDVPADDTVTPSVEQLLNLVPAGYATCEVVDPPVTGASATVDCGPNATPGGPEAATYSLFPDVDRLDAAFRQAVEEDTLDTCPGGFASPGTWDYQGTQGAVDGSVACGTYAGMPDLVWTRDADLFLGIAQDSDRDQLHQWWMENG